MYYLEFEELCEAVAYGKINIEEAEKFALEILDCFNNPKIS